MFRPALALSVLTTLAAADPACAQRGVYTDPVVGLQIKPPAKWPELPGIGGRGSLRACFPAPRGIAPRAGGAPQVPALRISFFSAADKARDSADERDGVPLATPFRDFADYAARGFVFGARVGARTPAKIGKLDGERVTVTVPRENGDLLLDCAVIPVDGGELVIEFEVLAEAHDKLAKDIERSFASAAPVERAEPVALPEPPWIADAEAWAKLSAKDRASQRSSWGDAWAAAQKERLPDGWKHYPHKRYVFVSRADSKFTKRAMQAADVFRDWLDERFDALSDEAVATVVVRIFDSAEEVRAYRARDTTRLDYSPARREMVFHRDESLGTGNDAFGALFRGQLQHYVEDKLTGASENMPRWLDQGIHEYVRSSRLKGKKIEFFPHEVENGRFGYHSQNDTTPAIWTLVQESIVVTPEDGAEEDVWGYTPECTRAIRWLEAGGGKALGHDAFLVAYFRGIATAIGGFGPDPAADVAWDLASDVHRRQVRKAQYARRDSLLKAINDAVIPLSVEKWEEANAAWLAFLEDF